VGILILSARELGGEAAGLQGLEHTVAVVALDLEAVVADGAAGAA
jgi:hypothetical protein